MSLEKAKKFELDIARKAGIMKDLLFHPVYDRQKGGFLNENDRVGAIKSIIAGSVFEAAEKGAPLIASTSAEALMGFCTKYGRLPSDDLLAAAYNGIQNGLTATNDGKVEVNGVVLEAAEMSTTEGILLRDHMVALILPVMLTMASSWFCTHIPGQHDQSEIFKIFRRAGSTWGGLTKGDRIDHNYNGGYSNMDQRVLVGTGDGTVTGASDEFVYDTTALYGSARPIRKKFVRVYHDHDQVAKDDGLGNLYGSFLVGATTVNVTGTVDYDTGNVNPVFSVAPALAVEIHVGIDVAIEKDPTLIPVIDHDMESQVLYPHESAIAGGTTLQSLWALKREYGLNHPNMLMTAMRNIIAADKDKKHIADLRFMMKDSNAWSMAVPDGLTNKEHYETLKQTLLVISASMMQATGTTGLTGLVMNTANCAMIKYMPAPYFKPVANYKQSPQPHYVGRLFDMYDVIEDPFATTNSNICYGKGQGLGETPYVTGSAIPPLPFKHSLQTDLNYKQTLYELAYRDPQPFDGREYVQELTFTS